jgi:hypothetical protein
MSRTLGLQNWLHQEGQTPPPPQKKEKENHWRISCFEEEQDLLFGRAKGKALHVGLRINFCNFSSKQCKCSAPQKTGSRFKFGFPEKPGSGQNEYASEALIKNFEKTKRAVHLGDGAGLVEPPRVAAITDGTHGCVGHGSTTANLVTAQKG